MLKNKLDNSNIVKHLGQTSQYKSSYDKNLLVREPRSNNRVYLNIHDDNLPFVGYDTWNAYECSFLLKNGRPVTGVGKLVYPCNSKYIVESKSIKLYLNSFNMTSLGDSLDYLPDSLTLGVAQFEEIVARDLSELLETNAKFVFHYGKNINTYAYDANYEWGINNYKNLDLLEFDYIFNQYTENDKLLDGYKTSFSSEKLFYSGLLKSNCRVTSQPDWGDIFIYIKTKYVINSESILKYIISFRDECHFHEEICECVYKKLQDRFEPEDLLVMCLYARRGGIDINPVRASNKELITRLADPLINPNVMHVKTSKQ